MKFRYTLITLALFVFVGSKAQISINYNEIPGPGFIVPFVMDSLPLPAINYGSAGANQVYDFSNLVLYKRDTTFYTAMTNTQSSNFPSGNIAVSGDNVNYLFGDSSNANLLYVGSELVLNGTTLWVGISPTEQQYQFPVQYQTNFINYYRIRQAVPGSLVGQGFPVDSVILTFTDSLWDTIDGWGKVITPLGSYEGLRDARRQHTHTNVIATLVFGGPVTVEDYSENTLEFAYYSKETKGPLVTFDYDSAGNIKDAKYAVIPPFPPIAHFTFTQGGQGLVNFTDSSTGYPTTYHWNFGDGDTSNLQNPNYTFPANGTYYVCETVSNAGGSNTYCDSVTISGLTQPAPVAAFSGTPAVGCTPDTVQFTDLSTNSPTSWLWTFSGGTPPTSTVQNPVIIYNTQGSYSVTLIATNAGGSDTISENAYINVNGSPSVTLVKADVLCYGDSTGTLGAIVIGVNDTYLWSNGSTSSAIRNLPAATYCVTVTDTHGCTTTVCDTITQPAQFYVSSNVIAVQCYGQSNGSINAAGHGGTPGYTYNWSTGSTSQILTNLQSGIYCLTAKDAENCTVAICDTVNQPAQIASTVNGGICPGGSYSFNGQTYTTAGTYADTLTAGNGCDSVVTLNLQVTSMINTPVSAAICSGSTYNFNGQTLSTGGTYTDTLQAIGGCDSVVTLTLSVNQPVSNTLNISVCNGSTYNFNGQVLTSSGTYMDTLATGAGCDSMVTLNLTVNAAINNNISASICTGHSYNFNGRTLTSSGTYTDTLTAGNSCDSVVTLNLTVANSLSTTINQAICSGQSYSFGGQNISATGTYVDSLTSGGGCDSIVTLNLTVNLPTTGSASAAICNGQSYTYNGQTYTAGGTYTATLTGSNGCDSVVTLTLSVNTVGSASLFDTIIQGASFTFNGQNLTAAGTYYDTVAVGNCDSITTLYLDVIAGMNDIALDNAFALYPNPANDLLVLQATKISLDGLMPEIYDVTGKVLVTPYTRQADKITFDVSKLAGGLYSIRLNYNGIIINKKFVKLD